MAKLGSVKVFVEKETENHSVDATKYPVEKGVPFTDHVSKNPSEFSMTGSLLTKTWQSDRDKLIKLMEKGEIVKYVGKTTVSNVVILNISGDHSAEIKQGMNLNFSLRKIRITTNAWDAANKKDKTSVKPGTKNGKKQPAGNKESKNTYHTVKSGDTYSGLAKKYGTTVAKLRELNPWDDTKIPIGAKLIVKK